MDIIGTIIEVLQNSNTQIGIVIGIPIGYLIEKYKILDTRKLLILKKN